MRMCQSSLGEKPDLEEGEQFHGRQSLMTDRLENYVRRIGNSGIQQMELASGSGPIKGAADINLEELNLFRQAVLQSSLPAGSVRHFLEEDVPQ